MADDAPSAIVPPAEASVSSKRMVKSQSVKPKKSKSAKSRFLGPIFGLSKPAVGAVLVYSVFATGAWVYLLPSFIALTQQVKELEAQVDLLETAVSDLSAEVDRYEEQNGKLEENLEELAEENEKLQLSNAIYAKLTKSLNNTVHELEEQNEILTESNEEYERLNSELNETAIALEIEVNALEAAIDDIGDASLEAARQNDDLFDVNEILQGLNGSLMEQVDTINGVTLDMSGEIDRLEETVDDLESILDFLEEAAEEVGESVEEIAAFLADEIRKNENLLLENLHNTYQQTATGWVCSFQSFFANDAFIENPDTPIGSDDYPEVILYVDRNVLEPLCLDVVDFQSFLSADNGLATPPVDVTVNQLISSVSEYTTDALNYYFPDRGEEGLTNEDWNEAQYDCANLPDEKKFSA